MSGSIHGDYVKAGSPLIRVHFTGALITVTSDVVQMAANAPNLAVALLSGNLISATGDVAQMAANAPGLVQVYLYGALISVHGDASQMATNATGLKDILFLGGQITVIADVSQLTVNAPLLNSVYFNGVQIVLSGDLAQMMANGLLHTVRISTSASSTYRVLSKVVMNSTSARFYLTGNLPEADVDYILEGLADVDIWTSPAEVLIIGAAAPPSASAAATYIPLIQNPASEQGATVTTN